MDPRGEEGMDDESELALSDGMGDEDYRGAR